MLSHAPPKLWFQGAQSTKLSLSVVVAATLLSHIMSAPQADGCYPRVDGRLLQSGKFSGMIVSLVGRFVPSGQDVGFRCADNVQIRLSIEHTEYPTIDMQDGPVVEVVGQVMDGGEVAVSR